MPCLLPGDLPNPGTEPTSLASHALQANSLPLSHGGKPREGIETKSTILSMGLSTIVCVATGVAIGEGSKKDEEVMSKWKLL